MVRLSVILNLSFAEDVKSRRKMIKSLKQKLEDFIINYPMTVATLLALAWIILGIYVI